ncbi:cytoplasmic protein [Fructobacillus cardui]|uniref:Beta-lactamase superfamily II (GloB) n=1 Tax=Fructobacillus cardui TaxID=2893170 RepID=A0ABM9N2D3_9LACO|nr:Glyoxylase or a related metal-dependent hydrolase [Fructobacillus cardui]CAK1254909.1 Glyoxylase or a related metal-dependent hydrolase [Fructobacillus cardui]
MKTQVKKVNNLALTIFGSDENSFMITNTLIVKEGHAVLVGTAFTQKDANEIASHIKDNGYVLDSVYLLHGDPDYYFGLETIKHYFPEVVAYATQSTFTHITESVKGKLDAWSDALGDQLPNNIVLPKIVQDYSFEIFGDKWEIVGDDSSRTSLWYPKDKILVGGIDTFNEINIFLADTATLEGLAQWKHRLQSLIELDPVLVIPSHGSLEKSFDKDALAFTVNYLTVAEEAMQKATDSSSFITLMTESFPGLENTGVLSLSAKVVMKEIPWG